MYKVNTLKVFYFFIFIYLFIYFWFRKIVNRQIIRILVCDSFCDCQLSTFGGVVQLAKVLLWLVVRPRQSKLGGGYVWPVTPEIEETPALQVHPT